MVISCYTFFGKQPNVVSQHECCHSKNFDLLSNINAGNENVYALYGASSVKPLAGVSSIDFHLIILCNHNSSFPVYSYIIVFQFSSSNLTLIIFKIG